MNQTRRDLAFGIGLLVFVAPLYWLSYYFTGQKIIQQARDVGPAFLPRLLLIALAVQAAFLIGLSLKNLARESPVAPPPPALWHLRPALVFLAFVVYVSLATVLGYVISTVAFLGLSFFLLGERKLWKLLLLPPAITLMVYLLFETLLEVWLPRGTIF
ncbi:MAG: tripartite tricarboxylate transporter TctB family protein [Thermodesulfobacteriota bacterium]